MHGWNDTNTRTSWTRRHVQWINVATETEQRPRKLTNKYTHSRVHQNFACILQINFQKSYHYHLEEKELDADLHCLYFQWGTGSIYSSPASGFKRFNVDNACLKSKRFLHGKVSEPDSLECNHQLFQYKIFFLWHISSVVFCLSFSNYWPNNILHFLVWPWSLPCLNTHSGIEKIHRIHNGTSIGHCFCKKCPQLAWITSAWTRWNSYCCDSTISFIF